MVAPLDQLLREQVAPALASEGYRKSRRLFTRENAAGDRAFIEFRSHPMGDGADVNVIIDVALQPRGYAEWLEFLAGRKANAVGMLLRRPRQPVIVGRAPDVWSLNLSDRQRADALIEMVVSDARSYADLLDRNSLLDKFRTGELPSSRDNGIGREFGLALLLSDDGPSPELDGLLPAIRASRPDFADFLTSRSLKASHAT